MLRVSAKNQRREASRLYKKSETRSIASLQKIRDAKHRVSTDIIENGSVARWLLLFIKIPENLWFSTYINSFQANLAREEFNTVPKAFRENATRLGCCDDVLHL